MKYILALTLIFLAGCATRSVPREPSIYLLSTDKEPRWLLDEVSKELVESKYEVESLDYNLGLLVMEPRRFVIERRSDKSYGEQTFQIRQEGGSVKIRITYECQYPEGRKICDVNDREANDKIRRIERLILAMINRKLFQDLTKERVQSKEI